MRGTRSLATGSVVLCGFGLLATGCADDPGGDATREVTCEDLDEQSDVEMVLCDDGETRIDRRGDQAPAIPEAERVE